MGLVTSYILAFFSNIPFLTDAGDIVFYAWANFTNFVSLTWMQLWLTVVALKFSILNCLNLNQNYMYKAFNASNTDWLPKAACGTTTPQASKFAFSSNYTKFSNDYVNYRRLTNRYKLLNYFNNSGAYYYTGMGLLERGQPFTGQMGCGSHFRAQWYQKNKGNEYAMDSLWKLSQLKIANEEALLGSLKSLNADISVDSLSLSIYFDVNTSTRTAVFLLLRNAQGKLRKLARHKNGDSLSSDNGIDLLYARLRHENTYLVDSLMWGHSHPHCWAQVRRNQVHNTLASLDLHTSETAVLTASWSEKVARQAMMITRWNAQSGAAS